MCIAQYDSPKKDAGSAIPNLVESNTAQASANSKPWLEVTSQFLSFTAFVLAIFILLNAFHNDTVCLPFSCHAESEHPMFYWIAVLAYSLLASLAAYFFISGIKTARLMYHSLKSE